MNDTMTPENLVWTTPSRDSSGSMPLGNGDIGLNVWVEENGDLLFYLSKTDAWDENAQLLKLGRIRLSLSPNPFVTGAMFRQELDLANGCIRIVAGVDATPSSRLEAEGSGGGAASTGCSILVWVDANRPVARVEVESAKPVALTVAVEHWRTSERVLPGTGDAVVWCHRNAASCWAATLEHQDMAGWVKEGHDPLLNRTFGALLRGVGLVKAGETALRTASPRTRLAFAIHPLTAQTETLAEWTEAVSVLAARNDALPSVDATPSSRGGQAGSGGGAASAGAADAFAQHAAWWRAFWGRSWIRVSGTPEAETVSRGYALQRFINACGGRGEFPIKFNGSIFTVDAREGIRDGYGDENRDADYRRWGGAYWFQNTRLTYWPMITSGDFDLMEPWFRMYLNALPFAMARAKANFGLDGAAMFPETMHFWGAYRNEDYGSNRGDVPPGLTENLYIRRYWQGMLELLAILLDTYATMVDATPPSRQGVKPSGEGAASAVSQDAEMRAAAVLDYLLALAPPFLRFYRDYYARRDDAGKLRLEPSQSLETWWETVNPLPDIAGLHWVLDGLLALPSAEVPAALRQEWEALRAILPPVPTRTYAGGKKLVIPALQYDGCHNCENPELYAIFPYRIYGVGKPDLETGRRTFAARQFKSGGGWQQDAIQAALLGLTDEARAAVVSNFSTSHKGSRFPAFWGPNFDWIPDQDHGAVACIALQQMLLQCDRGEIRLLPAWPREWNVDFRLHAPGQTVVEGRVEQGRLCDFRITPETRRKDVVVADDNGPVSWQVSGVLACPAGGVSEASCHGLDKATDWALLQPDDSGFLNLHDRFGAADGLVYLANRFEVPFTGRWRLSLGHDGGARVFVDGQPVLCAPETRNPAKPGRSTVELALTAGVHELVIAFDLASGNGWGVFFEWQVPDGEQADRVQRVYPRIKQ